MKFFSQLTLFCFFAILTTAGRGAENPNIGQDAPDLNLDGWATSKTLQQNALDGRPYALEFWATWCPPCRQSIPHLNELSQRMEPFGLRVLGLSEEGLDKVEPFATEMGMTYYVGAGHEMSGLKFDGIPFAAAVGADGKIEWAGHPMDAAFEKTLWKLTRDYAPQTLLPAIEKAEGGALGPAYETLQGIDTEQAKASMKRMRSNLDLRLEQAGTLAGLERYHALSDMKAFPARARSRTAWRLSCRIPISRKRSNRSGRFASLKGRLKQCARKQ